MIDIDRKNVEDVYSLSPLQEGILFHHIMDEKSTAYFVQAIITLNGEVDADLFEKTFNKTIEKYDILRTVYTYKKTKKPRQVVLKKREMQIFFKDISLLEEETKTEFINNFKKEDEKMGFNLARDIPMRISIIKMSSAVYTIVWSFHHIIMDGWCLGIIFRDLMRMYQAFQKGEPVKLEPVTPYKNYIEWLEKQDREKGLTYWKEYLKDYEQQARLPGASTTTQPSEDNNYRFGEYCFLIEEALTTDLNKIAVKNQVTINTVFQTLWGVLLQVYNNTEDVVFGAVVSNRPSEIEGIEQMVGLFINTVPVRIKSEGSVGFSQLLGKVQQNAALSRLYEYLSLAEIQAVSPLSRQLIHHIQAFENYPLEKRIKEETSKDTTGFVIEDMAFKDQTHYDFNIMVGPGKHWVVRCSFNQAVYEHDSIKKTESHLKQLITCVIKDPEIPVRDIDILTGDEKSQLLYGFNDTAIGYPENKSIHELFEEQVERTPNHIAVVSDTGQHLTHSAYMTYKELNKKSNQLAQLLQEKGVKAGDIVGIIAERSIEMAIGVLGILKAGGAYLPIDTDYPKERIKYMLAESNIAVLLTNFYPSNSCLSWLYSLNCQLSIVNCQLSMSAPEIPFHHSSNKFITHHSDLAYVIYTSGSTGQPKGVMVEHRNVVRLVKNTNYIEFREDDRILQTGALTFDASTFEIWGSLLNGLQLCLVSKDDILNAGKLKETIERYKVRTLWLTSPLFNQLSQEDVEIFSGLRNLLVGGDVLSPVHINRVRCRFPHLKIINGYGPTENTTFSTTFSIEREYEENIPIGKPIANSFAYIIGEWGKWVPIGVVGELYVGGHGVSRGYLNNPDLTNSKFQIPNSKQIPNYKSQITKKEVPTHPLTLSPIYKTGDLAQWLPDGNIEFLGRIDQQVKIRGFRIELEEIEHQLLKHSNVKEAVVESRSDNNGNKYLCAYIVPDETHGSWSPKHGERFPAVPAAELREFLSITLPSYMVPSYFTSLEKIPLTTNGKVDRRALPEPESETPGETFVPPGDKIEEILVEIWQEVLGIKKVGITDNFFEIGGDSIKAIQVSARLKKHKLDLKISDLYANPYIKELGKYVKGANQVSHQGIVKGEAPLTPIQKWFFQNDFIDPHHFNQAVMIYKEEGFDENHIKKVFTKIVEHHDALRMVFRKEGNNIVQRNRGLEGELFDFEVFNFKHKDKIPAEIEKEASRIQGSIDLEKGPLVKVGLFKTSGGDHLLIVIHHLVIDGISWRILFEDLGTGYRQLEQGEEIKFQEKTGSFMNWSQKLNEYASGITKGKNSKIRKELEYWRGIETTPMEPLPRDHKVDSAKKTKEYIESVSLELDEEETETLLKRVNWAYNTEINDILLTALGLSLTEWTGNQKVLINLEAHGRESIIEGVNLSRTVGWFTTQYPVVLDMSRSEDLSYAIKCIKETLRRIPNKGIGYGILRYLTPEEKKDGLVCGVEPEINFNYLGQFGQESSAGFIQSSVMSPGQSTSPALQHNRVLDINGMLVDGKLKLILSYIRYEYDTATIEMLADSYRASLLRIIDHCSKKEEKELTPSDLGYKKITLEDLSIITDYIKSNFERNLEIQCIYPLTPMQSGMLFHSLKSEETNAYFVQSEFRASGQIDEWLLEIGFNTLVKRYDILRTILVYEALEEPLQVVLKNRNAQVYYKDISHLTKEKSTLYLKEFKKKDKEIGFDLTKDILIRLSLFKTDANAYSLVWSFHHILMDGWCLGIVYRELIHIYQSLKQRQPSSLESVVPYKNYIDWLIEQDKAEGYRYWETYLEAYEKQAGLPISKRKVKNGEYIQEEYSQVIDEDETTDLNRLARKHQVTVNTLFQTSWGVLLQKYNNIDDVVFGAVVSGRPSEIEGIENIIGLLINTVPVRIKCSESIEFSQLLTDIQKNSISSKSYEYLSLAEIQANSALKGNLIDHIFIFENYPLQEEIKSAGAGQYPGFKIEEMEIQEQTNYDLDISIIPGSRFIINYSYNALVYGRDLIERTAARFLHILRQVEENPRTVIKNIEIITEKEKKQVLFDFNDNQMEYPKDKSVRELFEDQVEHTPDHAAVVFEDKTMTYQELNQKANQLGTLLGEKGIKPGDIAGIMVGKSIEMMVGIIGIVKAGGAYLPIDTNYPHHRINYMLADSHAGMLLVNSRIDPEINGNFTVIDLNHSIDSKDSRNPSVANDRNDILYVVYTSGSTGNPKGVVVQQDNYINAIYGWRKEFRLEKIEVNLLQMASVSFDVFSGDLAKTFFNGGKMVICPDDVKIDLPFLYLLIQKNRISLFESTPGLILPLMDYVYENSLKIDCLKLLILGSDVCKVEDFNQLFDRFGETMRIINSYGITETTIDSSYYEPRAGDWSLLSAVPIGQPLPNVKYYVVDTHLNLQPVGIGGELYIGGAGVARGYLNNAALTKEKYIADPFASTDTPNREENQVYKTGDLARWLSDGSIEFLGRIDNQVKIRGYRIELGEIENYLSAVDDIKESVVIAGNDKNDNIYLCAYLVSDAEIDAAELRSRLLDQLPGYMIPAHFIQIEKMPLSTNGKIDRKALPEPGTLETRETRETYAAPENNIEETLVEIWQKVIGVEHIGITDNFFEIGGDSIKAIQVSARLKKYNLDLKINDLFSSPTIQELASCVKETRRTIFQGIVKGELELTPIQRWFFENNFVHSHHFNMAVMLYREKGFREAYVEKVFAKIMEHHDALRMVYITEGDRMVQMNRGMEGKLFDLEIFNIENKCNIETEIENEANRLQAGINLENGPLVKIGLFKTTGGDHLLIIVHHLVIDGISWRILLEDFETGYRQLEQGETLRFQEKTDSFQYWSCKLKEYAESKALLRELPYWRAIEETKIEPLPVDYEIGRNENKSSDSEAVHLVLDEEETRKLLKEVNRAYHTNINDILLTALGLALREWWGIKKSIVNLEGHGREIVIEDMDIGRTVGWFSSEFPVILDMSINGDLSYAIKFTKETLRRIPNNGIGYGLLRYLTPLQKKEGVSFTFTPDISFNYLGEFDSNNNSNSNSENDGTVFTVSQMKTGDAVNPDMEISQVLDINGMVINDVLEFSFTYNKRKYKSDNIRKLSDCFKANLIRIIAHCTGKEEEELTPSDVGDEELSLEEFNDIKEMIA